MSFNFEIWFCKRQLIKNVPIFLATQVLSFDWDVVRNNYRIVAWSRYFYIKNKICCVELAWILKMNYTSMWLCSYWYKFKVIWFGNQHMNVHTIYYDLLSIFFIYKYTLEIFPYTPSAYLWNIVRMNINYLGFKFWRLFPWRELWWCL